MNLNRGQLQVRTEVCVARTRASDGTLWYVQIYNTRTISFVFDDCGAIRWAGKQRVNQQELSSRAPALSLSRCRSFADTPLRAYTMECSESDRILALNKDFTNEWDSLLERARAHTHLVLAVKKINQKPVCETHNGFNAFQKQKRKQCAGHFARICIDHSTAL